MRSCSFCIILLLLLVACSHKSGERTDGKRDTGNDIIGQAITLAENYLKSRLNGAQKMVSGNGIITLANGHNMFVIEPKKVFTGLVNEDPVDDVIVSVAAFEDQNQIMTRHFILLNTNGKLALDRVIESDMEILWIKNGIITAEVPTHPRNSPLFNCSECRDVVNFRFQGGELVRVE